MVLGAFAEDEEPGQAWSPYMRSLERQVFNPVRLQPEADEPDKSAKPEKKDEQLCLLPLKE